MNILAIESSCDETAAAIVEDGVTVLSNVIATSHEMHEKYGGIVPEVAARMQLESIIPVITEALKSFSYDDIDAIAVTIGPGLIGSLLVGVETAKTISLATGKPLIPVNHVLAHMYANFVSSPQSSVIGHQIDQSNSLKAEDRRLIAFPAISLVVSGGHTELYLMKSAKELRWLGGTLDDAAGECFDKTARLMGFGHGGGLAIQESAKKYSITNTQYTTKLPRPMLDKKNELNFSFSGLKTAIMREYQKCHPGLDPGSKRNNIDSGSEAGMTNALAYDVQETITDVLVKKTLLAAGKYSVKSILLSGGVASNLRLREKFSKEIASRYPALTLHVPPVPLCTDNAVYIASYAYFRGIQTPWQKITAVPDLSVEVDS